MSDDSEFTQVVEGVPGVFRNPRTGQIRKLMKVDDSDLRWHLRFLKLSEEISTWSKDPSMKIGCVIVGPNKEIRSTGFNGFPRGVNDNSDRYANRDLKLMMICHSEENAILNAARIGTSLDGCTLYCMWIPCTRCARGIIQVGIKRVIVPDVEIPERWKPDFQLSAQMLGEAKVQLLKIPAKFLKEE